MSRKTKTDITESQWLALVESNAKRELEPPPNSKTVFELCRIWKYSIHHSRCKIKQLVNEGKANQTLVGNKAYYTLK